MQPLRLSPLRLRGLSSTPQRATLRGHNTKRLVVIATSWCGVMVRQSHQSNTAAKMRPKCGRALRKEESKIKGVLDDPLGKRMTREDWLAFRTAVTCHVCEKPLEGDSVRDHCHITGECRGAARNACNLKLRLNPKTTSIPVVLHNLRRYDSRLPKVEGRVSCIPNNKKKYISFSLGQLRFIDSAQFFLASLDKLVAANPPETLP